MLQKVDERRNLDRLNLNLKVFARESGEQTQLPRKAQPGSV